MNYKEITLADKVYRIDQMNWLVIEMNIVAIIFIPAIIGPREKVDLSKSVLQLVMANGTKKYVFSLTSTGAIIDDDNPDGGLYFDKQDAKEDCIILKTKYERESNLGMQDLHEEGEYGQKPENEVVGSRNGDHGSIDTGGHPAAGHDEPDGSGTEHQE